MTQKAKQENCMYWLKENKHAHTYTHRHTLAKERD